MKKVLNAGQVILQYVDFNRNDTSGFIRFETADEAKLAVEKGTNGVAIANTHIATVRAVEGKYIQILKTWTHRFVYLWLTLCPALV